MTPVPVPQTFKADDPKLAYKIIVEVERRLMEIEDLLPPTNPIYKSMPGYLDACAIESERINNRFLAFTKVLINPRALHEHRSSPKAAKPHTHTNLLFSTRTGYDTFRGRPLPELITSPDYGDTVTLL